VGTMSSYQEKPLTEFNWFLSHKQSTGQGIVLPLFLEMEKIGETAFLDIKAEFELHDLEKLVKKTKYFVFLLTPEIFTSEYCKKGKKSAM
jgi:hypothetical protein